MSLYGNKTAQAAVQPWISDIATGKNIFDFYDSLGDVVISTSTNIPSVLDGPMVVRKYRDLTINAAAADVLLSVTNRCRGLMLLVEGNLLMQRTASYVPSISMTARGARGHSGMGLYDFSIPSSIQLSGKGWSKADALKMIREQGYAICDRWLWDDWGKINGVSAVAWTAGTVLLSAGGCGNITRRAVQNVNTSGRTGGAGTNGGTGGGGEGGYYWNTGIGGMLARGGKGCPWGGGVGGGGCYYTDCAQEGDDCGGKGGEKGYSNSANGSGAGNPDGDGNPSGSGGVIVVICKGSVTLNTGSVIEADGVQAPAASLGPGGSSGGGHVSLVTFGSLTNNGTIRANGGVLRAGGVNGGAGGAGSVVTKTFAQMGW